ncbi:hypothetical protein HWV62_12859 [Athelia sp. TMB]|nr:hypothetical protein HWV62_12859 [Athelia sp. TMB]
MLHRLKLDGGRVTGEWTLEMDITIIGLNVVLQIYRFYIICNFGYWSLAVPLLMYLGAIVTSIFLLIFTARSDVGFWSDLAVHIGTAYWSLTVALNVIITILICFRLLRTRNRVRKAFGFEHGKLYNKVTTMFIESAALYSIWGLILVVAYARGDNGLRNIFQGALGEGITTLLIVVRVGQGRAYMTNSSEDGPTVNTLQFVEQTLTYQSRNGEITAMADMQSMADCVKGEDVPASSSLHSDSRTSLEFKAVV